MDLEKHLRMSDMRGDDVDWSDASNPAGTAMPMSSSNGGGDGNYLQRPGDKRQNSQVELFIPNQFTVPSEPLFQTLCSHSNMFH